MNHAMLAGHLGDDPEVRFTSSGQKVTTLRVAARVRRGAKDETIWWKVTIWGEQFDKMIPYFKKGSPIVVIGEMNKPEIFTDREGKPQVSMSLTAFSISFSPFGRPDGAKNERNDSASEHGHAAAPSSYGEPAASRAPASSSAFSDDEVPF
jgi:single-strand DNA-binding protein